MGGQRVSVRKPRVRQNGREVELPSWSQFADRDPLNERTLEQLALGVSTRGYRRSVEDLLSAVLKKRGYSAESAADHQIPALA